HLLRLSWRRPHLLRNTELIAFRLSVPAVLNRDLGGAGLLVPAPEPAEIDAARILHRGDEILDRHRVVVVPTDIEIHAAAEPVPAEEGMDHAYEIGPFFV